MKSLFDPDTEALRVARQELPWIYHNELTDPALWAGSRVHDPETGFVYTRVQLLQSFHIGFRSWRIAIHHFQPSADNPLRSAMHNHRMPIAVIPFARPGSPGPVYEMEWSVAGSKESGRCQVQSGQAYTVEEPLHWYHSIHILQECLSVVIMDVTKGFQRENRLRIEAINEDGIAQVLGKAGDWWSYWFPEIGISLQPEEDQGAEWNSDAEERPRCGWLPD